MFKRLHQLNEQKTFTHSYQSRIHLESCRESITQDESLPLSIRRHFDVLGLPYHAREPEVLLATQWVSMFFPGEIGLADLVGDEANDMFCWL